jgi:hypothetical protein
VASEEPGGVRELTPVSDATAAKIAAAIEEEFTAFTDELAALRGGLAAMDLEVGEQEDKVRLATRLRLQGTFAKDVIETTKCQVI